VYFLIFIALNDISIGFYPVNHQQISFDNTIQSDTDSMVQLHAAASFGQT